MPRNRPDAVVSDQPPPLSLPMATPHDRHVVQTHIWLTRGDLELLKQTARDRDQSVSAVVRRLVRGLRNP
jgi:hypothetical protein